MAYPRAVAVSVGAYLLIVLGRAHEIIPQLAPFRLGLVGAVVAVAVAFPHFRASDFKAFLATPAGKGFVLTTVFAVLTIPTAEWPKASFTYFTRVHFNVLLLLSCAALAFIDRRAMRWIIVALVVDVMLAGLDAMRRDSGRFAIGLTYDANETAALFVMTIPWAIYLVMTEKRLSRWIGLAAIPVFLLGVLKTGSRGGLLGVIAIVPFLILLSPPRRRGPFIMAVIIGGLATVLGMGEQAMFRFRKAFDTSEYNYNTEDGRIEVWKRGLGYIVRAPVQGVGMDGFQYKELASKSNKGYGVRQTAAHNMYIQVAAELGLIGFTGFMLMLLGGLHLGNAVRKRMHEVYKATGSRDAYHEMLRAAMAQVSLFSLMCTGFFLSMGHSAMLYFAVGAAGGVWLGNKYVMRGGPPGHLMPSAPARRPRAWRTARPIPVSGLSSSR